MEIISKIKKWLHVHSFTKPIVSMYISFNTRDIIYECKCGKRMSTTEYREQTSFPIPTTHFLTRTEYQNILKNEKKCQIRK
jgi:hypothetical protein